MNGKKPVIIDTDLGDDIDDAMALCLAMQSPELEILGVTTVHRCAEYRARMVKSLLKAGGFGYVPVYAGYSKPLRAETLYGRKIDYSKIPESYLPEFEKTEYDGDDAVGFLSKTLKESKEPVTIVTMGALTNIAALYQSNPEAFDKIDGMFIMGGAYNQNFGEYNFCCDPDAAAIVMASGKSIHSVGIDITLRCKLTEEQQNRIFLSDNPCLKMLARMRKQWRGDVCLHDPLALYCAIDPGFVRWERRVCAVERKGEFFSGYVVNLSDWNWQKDSVGSNVYVGCDVDEIGFGNEYVRRILQFEK